MSKDEVGLYEVLITEALERDLGALSSRFDVRRGALESAEAPDRLALHLARVIERAVATRPEHDRVAEGIVLAQRLLAVIATWAPPHDDAADILAAQPGAPAEVLHAILARRPDGTPSTIAAPLIPLLDTTLLTNARGEPRVGSQLVAEIASADRIDVVMAFVRRSGIQPMVEALRLHCEAGRTLRVLTTTYTGSTEARALDQLRALGAEVRISYDHSGTRLHAKAWLFQRRSGFSTAYIGSSNLTHSAQVSGLEWNVRVSAARNRHVVDRVEAVFESYWHHHDFVPYKREEFEAREGAQRSEATTLRLSPIELRPEPFQERLLEQIALSRALGHHRNLLVSATGTGKTVMAALDYVRLRDTLPRARLLFVAHREEILTQSLDTFRYALRDPAFGELWVNDHRPKRFEHVFASIQSLHAARLALLDPAHFDVVVVDEFHHAAAHSYRALLEHLRPVELLGLTATPERTDGLDVLLWFEGRIAAELRLWDAIDQHRLCPFVYFGVHDGLDLRDIAWRRGRGYDAEGLSKLYTGNDVWARFVLKEIVQRIDDVGQMRALGFCVSVDHARFMARVFRAAGVAATAVWSDTPDTERREALRDLAARRVNVVFSVDLFNEGVDVPTVDTLLLLRPTDSPTLFLQQLGRGLRRIAGKTVCTVLDFVGHHRKEFRLDRRYRALLGGGRRDLIEQIEMGFPFLPAGCHLQLDPVARDIVLQNLRTAVATRWDARVEALRDLAQGDSHYPLQRYLDATGLDLDEIYAGGRSWSDLCAAAGLAVHASGPHEVVLRRACGRLGHLDDALRINTYQSLLREPLPPDLPAMSERSRRLLRMLVVSMVGSVAEKTTTLAEGCALLWAHPQVIVELRALLDVLSTRITHLTLALEGQPDVPLEVHGRYTRLEILAAYGLGEGVRVAQWQTGVYWAKAARTDLLAFTLDKTSGKFSPTTRYRDYAISSTRIHWESQSATRADSDTGQRYQRHASLGTHMALFARLRQDERAFYFLGPATYVSHTSEQPMAITWQLHHALPGDLYASFAAVAA